MKKSENFDTRLKAALNKSLYQKTKYRIVGSVVYSSIYTRIYNAKKNGEDAAIKVILVDKQREHNVYQHQDLSESEKRCDPKDSYDHELHALQSLRNIGSVYTVEILSDGYVVDFEDWEVYYFIMKKYSPLIDTRGTNKQAIFNPMMNKWIAKYSRNDTAAYLGYCIANTFIEMRKAHIENNRDIKPENLYLANDEENMFLNRFILGDFGESHPESSVITTAQAHIGTKEYIPGNQENNTSWKYDQFMLGVTMYEIFNGMPIPPYESRHEDENMRYADWAEGNSSIPAPVKYKIDEDLFAIIKKMTSYNSDERYNEINQLISDLASAIKNKEFSDNRDSCDDRVDKIKTNKTIIKKAICAVLIIAFTCSTVFFGINRKKDNSEQITLPGQNSSGSTDLNSTSEEEQSLQTPLSLEEINIIYSGISYGLYSQNGIDFFIDDQGFHAYTPEEDKLLCDKNCSPIFIIQNNVIYFSVVEKTIKVFSERDQVNTKFTVTSGWSMNLDGSDLHKILDFNGSGYFIGIYNNKIIFADDEDYTTKEEAFSATALYKYDLSTNERDIICDRTENSSHTYHYPGEYLFNDGKVFFTDCEPWNEDEKEHVSYGYLNIYDIETDSYFVSDFNILSGNGEMSKHAIAKADGSCVYVFSSSPKTIFKINNDSNENPDFLYDKETTEVNDVSLIKFDYSTEKIVDAINLGQFNHDYGYIGFVKSCTNDNIYLYLSNHSEKEKDGLYCFSENGELNRISYGTHFSETFKAFDDNSYTYFNYITLDNSKIYSVQSSSQNEVKESFTVDLGDYFIGFNVFVEVNYSGISDNLLSTTVHKLTE